MTIEDVIELMRSDKCNEWPDEIKVIEEARDIILELARAYQGFYGGELVARAFSIAATV